MDASGLWSFVYSINFQIRQIQARNQHFSVEKSLLLFGSRFLRKEKHFFWQANRKKLILPLEKYFKILKDMIIGTAGT